MDRGGAVVVPWEHWVCSQCWQRNHYAVWLIKLRCFKPNYHRGQWGWTLVSIEPSSMRLVEIRQPPANIEQHGGPVPLCQSLEHCQTRQHCQFPHSDVEYQTWEFIRTLFKDKNLKALLCSSNLMPQSPTDVCEKCYDSASPFNNTRWLTWLECAQHPEHRDEMGVTLIVGDNHEVVKVIELPKSLAGCQPQQLALCEQGRDCPGEYSCKKAHSTKELEYWKWTLIHRVLEKVSNYCALRERYNYEPHEEWLSASQVGIDEKLSAQNYVDKFHHLICLDEIAHCKKMATLCNGSVTLELVVDDRRQTRSFKSYGNHRQQSVSMLKLCGMEGAAMDYAIHGHAIAHIQMGQSEIDCVVSHRDPNNHGLLLHLPEEEIPPLPKEPVYVHFEINHKYFDGLRKAVDYLSPIAVSKLLPEKKHLKRAFAVKSALSTSEKSVIKEFTLDSEYQMRALKQMISSDPKVPFLVIGAFGTGKTHILAAAASALLCDPTSHILVCTYQHQCADSIYKKLYRKYGNKIMRLVPNHTIARLIRDHTEGVALISEVQWADIERQRVVVTTFLTATNLRRFESGKKRVRFSHILIDEGAQAREPESLAALAVVKEDTKIVIVGDNKQSGPKVAVLSEIAQEYELGMSLLERLFNLYKSTRSGIRNHTASLLTNYRCHPSILAFTSSLFYQHTLLSRSTSETHPLAPFPLVFTCSSIDKNTANLPAEDLNEARVLVEKMYSFVSTWPRSKPKQRVGLLASTRKQVEVLRQEIWKQKIQLPRLPCEVEVKPTYLIQGYEFAAVFLSTIEPTNDKGEPFDPVRNMSNELVFNTIMTRARSLIYCVGNPFTLCQIGEKYGINSWKAYLQRCVQCETLQFEIAAKKSEIEAAAKEVKSMVFPDRVIDEVTQIEITNEADQIIEHYMHELNRRKEYKIGCKLVQKPEGDVDWMMEDEADTNGVVLCQIQYSHFNKAVATPRDGSQPPVQIQGDANLKGALPGDTVRVDITTKRVLFDERTERAIKQTHFQSSFLCRVSEFNCIMFYPLDKKYPKFVNLPTISREEKRGVVCFDPVSINNTPKVSNVIPHEVALRMVFVVKFLAWKEARVYPLGIIVGAFPSQSPHFQELMFKMKHNIPAPITDTQPLEKVSEESAGQLGPRQHFPLAITIDPDGSTDHDDALTCMVKMKGDRKIYQIGVHITDLHCFVRKGGGLDNEAKQRGCTVYNAPDSICSAMFPATVLAEASIQPGKQVNTFSVLTDFTISNEGSADESIVIGALQILESSTTSQAELTYKEAQALLVGDGQTYPQGLLDKMRAYDSQGPHFTLRELIQQLWKFARFLRGKRLGEAALAYTVREEDQLRNPEAHYLVEELMIRANTQVAKKLSRDFTNETIVRSQKPPEEKELKQFATTYKTTLPLSAGCKVLFPDTQPPSTTAPLLMLKSVYQMLRENLQGKKCLEVMHCVQMEHLHPQLLALQSRLRSLQSSAEYCVVKDGEYGAHSDLKCSHYTHFTSPLRRYIDIVIQRQLHAALNKSSNTVYSVEDLTSICVSTQGMLKKAREYERDVESWELFRSLQTNQRVYDCIVSEMDTKRGTLSLCFTDVELNLGPKAREITTHQLHKNHSTAPRAAQSEPRMPYKWKVKLCSMNGTPAAFLDPTQVEICSGNEGEGQLTFYSQREEENKCITNKVVNMKVRTNVTSVPSQTWKMIQKYAGEGLESIEAHSEEILRNLSPDEEKHDPIQHRDWRCILLVYSLSRELKLFDVMKAQLCAAEGKKGLVQEPAIQLLEVGPGLQLCVHHKKDPEKCFVGTLTQEASKDNYASLSEYVKCWEPLILSESALTSVKESELLLIRDANLQWPRFQFCTSSSGTSYYRMTECSDDPEKSGVLLALPTEFMQSSYNFFKMSEGDLVCIRLTSSDGLTRYVLHMVISKVKKFEGTSPRAEVYMKFVQEKANYISEQVHHVITNGQASYEIQLIHSSLPQRRIYRSLIAISRGEQLAKDIAVGSSVSASGHGPKIRGVLSEDEQKVAKSYWPMKDKRNLNRYQQKAIDLAWKGPFTIIQGPPGTGKSVTGAHIAYALAMRLCKEQAKEKGGRACVMYCGPSQQSVNVVLDKFLELLNHAAPAKENLNIIRVFSKGMEKMDFPGPERDGDVFVPTKASARCERQHEEYSLHHKVRRYNRKIAEMAERFETLHRHGKIPSFKDMAEYRKMISEAEEGVLTGGVNIILCTCNEAGSHRITNTLKPKYCIIDECAMATEPECMVPIRRAEHVVLIGDHQQLQAVIQCKEAERMGLGKSLFERYAKKGHEIHILETQYRMHRAICEFPSKVFYNRQLKTDESVDRRRSGLDLAGFWPRGEQLPIVFCQVEGEENTGHIGSRGNSKVDSQSKFNQGEATKIVDIAERLVCVHRVPNSEIAILTPYSAQKEEISRKLRQRIEQQTRGRQEVKLNEKQLQVKTITESQGSEYGIVLLSTVRSRGMAGEEEGEAADIGWIRKNLGFVADPHRICVGITRSKHGLVIVGNEKLLKYDSIWKKLIAHYKEKRCFVKDKEFPH